MKRFLLLFCTVVLVCSIMVVPAFAFETIRVHYSEDHFESFTNSNNPIPSGEYFVSFYIPALDSTLELGSLEVILQPYYISCEPDDPYCDAVISAFTYETFDTEPVDAFAFEVVWDWNGSEYILVDDPSFSSALAYIDDIEYLDVVVELTPVAPEPVTGGSPLSGVFGVFGGVGSWCIAQLGSLSSIFWNADAGALTFLGVLAVAALALAVILLLAFVVVRFLRFRG